MSENPVDPEASGADPVEEPTLSRDELITKLDQLQASATQQYSLKNYNAAAEFFSEAAEIQDRIHGEMALANSDLLYQYGRCLYHVAVSKSDVLGGKVASTEEPRRKRRKVTAAAGAESSSSAVVAGNGEGSSGSLIGDALKSGEQKTAEEVVEAVVDEKTAAASSKDANTVESKPFFQITGDENWTDSEDDEEGEGEEAEEEDDDFATAYEILDMARLLWSRKVEAAQNTKGGDSVHAQQELRQSKERLADIHDLQAEISLENERFVDAIADTRDGLALKIQLYPEESSLIAEAHFKLSLALEFASVTATEADEAEGGESSTKIAQVDEAMRAEAALEMEKAIASCNARIAKEKATISDLAAEKQAELRKSIAEVAEMVADMRQRLVDLRNPAVSLSGATGPAGAPDGSDPLRGVLGAMLGESKAQQQKRIEEATKNANDLTGLIKHKKKPKVENPDEGAYEGKGKRKLEETDAASVASEKKVKFENGV